jgi:hypothetical protein
VHRDGDMGDRRTIALSEATRQAALREAENSLVQARADTWGAFDALVRTDQQAAVDRLLLDLGQRVGPLVGAVMRLGGDPRRCWPRGGDPGITAAPGPSHGEPPHRDDPPGARLSSDRPRG